MKQLSIEQARELYGLGGKAAEIAVELFPEIAERKLPKTWDQFARAIGRSIYTNTTTVPSDIKGAIDAICKLYMLKQEYNGDWVADWKDETQNKYCISFYNGEQEKNVFLAEHKFLAFKSSEIMGEFAANFKELIEAAKPLLG